jgi:hypothetical protein
MKRNEALRNAWGIPFMDRLGYSHGPTNHRDGTGVQRHSARRTLMRSMEAARRAGSNEASHARSNTKTAARLSTCGSKGLTPNKKESSSGPDCRPSSLRLSAGKLHGPDRNPGAPARAAIAGDESPSHYQTPSNVGSFAGLGTMYGHMVHKVFGPSNRLWTEETLKKPCIVCFPSFGWL